MKSAEFKARILELIFPPVLETYEREFLPLFLNISKPAFQSMIGKDESNPFQNLDWAFLYLDEEQLYQQTRAEVTSNIFAACGLNANTQEEPKEMNERLVRYILLRIQRYMRNFSFDDEHNQELELLSNQLGFEQEFFVKVSIAQFYNSLSVVQNGKRLNYFVNRFIERGKKLDLIKAVKVDPSVLELDAVKNRLNELSPVKRHNFDTSILSAVEKPSLTPDKRKKYLMLAIFLNFASALGFLSKPNPITNPKLQQLAIKFGLITDSYIDDEFRKLAIYYRNR
ncbi:hypothetical protein [Thiomicrorhabdus xiamenensis]|uniref:Uncharacterized protein n=1 Tax=Thiomicrorhabdus xiamenensis TaxID=2739063 RepID=A0A7D4SIN5_9GAMM|nr:hypothetical protein [Thiomicrorhabdus xiamenensis]QKI88899.1 hypothetical protein HQN79_04610 [Thiomicrorhabdus xiamenensis]